LLIAAGIVITILMGIGIWIWVRRKFGLGKSKNHSQPIIVSEKPIDDLQKEERAVQLSQPSPKKKPSLLKYFTCPKCNLVYRADMKGDGGCKNCLSTNKKD
jgi:hypothetical protein